MSDCTTTSDTTCEACPAGTSCSDDVLTSCSPGNTFQPEPTKSFCLECSTCAVGTYKVSNCTTTTDTVCEECPAGSSCLDEVKTSCPALSMYQPEPSKSFCLQCTTCPPGSEKTSECSTTSDSVCTQCIPPTYSDDGLTCKQCDGLGEYVDTPGASSCKSSPAG